MKFDFEQFIKTAKSIKLKDTERSDIRRALESVIAKEQINVERKQHSVSHKQWSTGLSTNNLRFKIMPIVLILVLLGGGVSLAAEKSLPGDTLYPVKVGVNENVRGFFAVTDQAKAAWEVDLADRRLNEAEKLAAQERLSTEVRTQLEQNFQEHADKVEANIAKFESKDINAAADINANLETSLKVHSRILETIGVAKDSNIQPEVQMLLDKVKTETNDATKNKNQEEDVIIASSSAGLQTAAEGKMKAAQNKIDEVGKFIASKKDKLGAQASTQAEARLTLANNTFAQGKAKLNAGAYGDAFKLFQQAQSTAQEAKLLIQAKEEFDEETPSPTPTASVSSSPTTSPTASINAKIESEDEIEHGSSSIHNKIKIDLGI